MRVSRCKARAPDFVPLLYSQRWMGGPVMIIEDDQDIRDVLCEMVENAGHVVLRATNGREGLDLLRDAVERPRMIFLDLMMPVMDGRQFMAELHQDAALAEIPVVLLTANGSAGRSAADVGAVGFLDKPFRPAALMALLERFG
jgi:CheY-like chemotaxis protein